MLASDLQRVEELKEGKDRLGVPDALGNPLALNITNMAAKASSADEHVLVALTNRNDVRSEERVIHRRQEEERFSDFVHSGRHISLSLIFSLGVATSFALDSGVVTA